MKLKIKTWQGVAVAFPAIFLAGAVSYMWRAFVLVLLWGWFVVPLFALPPLRIPFAIGLSLVGSMMASSRGYEDDEEGPMDVLIRAALTPSIVLLVGWIASKFV